MRRRCAELFLSTIVLPAALLVWGCQQTLAVKADVVQAVAASIAASKPGISLTQGTTTVTAGGAAIDLGSVALGQSKDTTFTIANPGGTPLALSGSPGITGTNASEFSIQALSGTSVAAGASTTFAIRFTPATAGMKSATITIASNAAAFSFTISATGVTPPSLTITVGAGGTTTPSGANNLSSGVAFSIVATPNSGGYLFVNWTVSSGTVTLANANSANTTATMSNGATATIQANFTPPTTRNWAAVASDSTGKYLAGAVQGGQIYTSTNYGATWNLQTGSPSATWDALASDSTGQYLVAGVYSGGLYTSTNYGTTWTHQTSGLPAASTYYQASVASDSTGQYLVLGLGSQTIYNSTNYGVSWTTRSAGLPATANWSSVASDSTGTYLVAAYNTAAGAGGNVYVSVDGGAHWAAQSVNNGVTTFTGPWTCVAINSTVVSADPQYVAAATSGDIWWFHFNGMSVIWNDYVSGLLWTSIVSDSTGAHLAATVSGGTIYTYTSGTWTAQTSGLPASASWGTIASDYTGSYLVAAAWGGHIYTSTNYGASWTLKL